MEPLPGPVDITVNATCGALIARLCVELGVDDPGNVIARAVGLLDLAQRTKRQGGKLLFLNEHGDAAEVAF